MGKPTKVWFVAVFVRKTIGRLCVRTRTKLDCLIWKKVEWAKKTNRRQLQRLQEELQLQGLLVGQLLLQELLVLESTFLPVVEMVLEIGESMNDRKRNEDTAAIRVSNLSES